jgi:hypothetical protein
VAGDLFGLLPKRVEAGYVRYSQTQEGSGECWITLTPLNEFVWEKGYLAERLSGDNDSFRVGTGGGHGPEPFVA